jgi:putative transposase
MMDAVHRLAPTVSIESACEALGVARASFYRQPVFGPAWPAPARPIPARALSAEERETVRDVLNSTRFQDCRPPPFKPLCSMRASICVRHEPCIVF